MMIEKVLSRFKKEEVVFDQNTQLFLFQFQCE